MSRKKSQGILTKKSGWAVDETGKIEVHPEIQKLYDEYGTQFKTIDGIKLTKDMARVCFANGISQRDLNKSTINQVRSDINEGKWDPCAMPFTFNPDKQMSNGQNRCVAIELSNLKEGEFIVVNIQINVPKKTTERLTDGEMKRSPKDRLAIFLKNRDNNPRSPFKGESEVLTNATCHSPAKKVIGYPSKLSYDLIVEMYGYQDVEEAIYWTFNLYKRMNLSPKRKTQNVFWSTIARAYGAFKEAGRLDDLERFAYLSLNAATNTESSSDGWGKLTFDAISNYRASKEKGLCEVKERFYATIIEYLHNFFMKIPCVKVNSRVKTTRFEEYFWFDHEKKIMNSEIEQEKESVMDGEIISNTVLRKA